MLRSKYENIKHKYIELNMKKFNSYKNIFIFDILIKHSTYGE